MVQKLPQLEVKMKTSEELRKANLSALIAGVGSVNDFADKVGKNPSQVSQWRSDGSSSKNIGSSVAREIEAAFGKPRGWLDQDHSETGKKIAQGFMPEISWVQAGGWAEAFDPYEPGDGLDWHWSSTPHSSSSFALKVKGDSMKTNDENGFYHGEVIFVDPEKEAKHGSLVIAKMEEKNEVTFKKLTISETGEMKLEALNPDWKPRYIDISSAAHICGVVFGKTSSCLV